VFLCSAFGVTHSFAPMPPSSADYTGKTPPMLLKSEHVRKNRKRAVFAENLDASALRVRIAESHPRDGKELTVHRNCRIIFFYGV